MAEIDTRKTRKPTDPNYGDQRVTIGPEYSEYLSAELKNPYSLRLRFAAAAAAVFYHMREAQAAGIKAYWRKHRLRSLLKKLLRRMRREKKSPVINMNEGRVPPTEYAKGEPEFWQDYFAKLNVFEKELYDFDDLLAQYDREQQKLDKLEHQLHEASIPYADQLEQELRESEFALQLQPDEQELLYEKAHEAKAYFKPSAKQVDEVKAAYKRLIPEIQRKIDASMARAAKANKVETEEQPFTWLAQPLMALFKFTEQVNHLNERDPLFNEDVLTDFFHRGFQCQHNCEADSIFSYIHDEFTHCKKHCDSLFTHIKNKFQRLKPLAKMLDNFGQEILENFNLEVGYQASDVLQDRLSPQLKIRLGVATAGKALEEAQEQQSQKSPAARLTHPTLSF